MNLPLKKKGGQGRRQMARAVAGDTSFIHVTDVHIRRGKEGIQGFFAAMRDACLVHRVDFLVSTGDFFDTRDQVVALAGAYRRQVHEFPVPVYTVIGNHEAWNPGEPPRNYDTHPFEQLIGPLQFHIERPSLICIFVKEIDEQHDPAPFRSEQVQQWLRDARERHMTALLFQHCRPNPESRRLQEFASLGIDAIFSGHRHMSKITHARGCTSFNSSNSWGGGIDYSPAGARLVMVSQEGQITTTMLYVDWNRRLRRFESRPALSGTVSLNTGDHPYWPQFLQNGQRCPDRSSQITPDLNLVSRLSLGGTIGQGSPVIDQRGLAFVATRDREGLAANRLTCVDLEAGRIRWRVNTHSAVAHSPVLHGDLVLTSSIGGRVQAFARDDGTEKWYHDLGSSTDRTVFSCPILTSDGRLCCGNASYACCLDAETGREHWHRRLGGCDGVWSNITFGAGRDDWVFCGGGGSFVCDESGSRLYQGPWIALRDGIGYGVGLACLDARNGDVLWTHGSGSAFSTPSIQRGKLYYQVETSLFCLDVSSGQQLWKADLPALCNPNVPLVTDELVITSVVSGKLLALENSTGELVWTYGFGAERISCQHYHLPTPGSATKHALSGSAICRNDRVFVVATDGYLHCVDIRDGSPIHRWNLGNPSMSSPVPLGKGLLVATFAGELLAFQ